MQCSEAEEISIEEAYITIKQSMTGWYPVLMVYCEDDGWEIWQACSKRYDTPNGALMEAKRWAQVEELECVYTEIEISCTLH